MARTQVETRTYTLADAAAILGTSEARVLQLLDAGLPEHAPSARRPGARFLAFQDLVLLRNAKRLVDQDVAPARVVDALRQLRAQLPEGTPPVLSASRPLPATSSSCTVPRGYFPGPVRSCWIWARLREPGARTLALRALVTSRRSSPGPSSSRTATPGKHARSMPSFWRECRTMPMPT